MKEVKSKSYTLRGENGEWLGQIVLTSDGMFASVTDWGNFSYAWRTTDEDFRKFISSLNVGYFSQKLINGMAYVVHSKPVSKACERFAEKILPPLQAILKEEIQNNLPW